MKLPKATFESSEDKIDELILYHKIKAISPNFFDYGVFIILSLLLGIISKNLLLGLMICVIFLFIGLMEMFISNKEIEKIIDEYEDKKFNKNFKIVSKGVK